MRTKGKRPRKKQVQGDEPPVVQPCLEMFWLDPTGAKRRILMVWSGPANDATLSDWISEYNAAVGPGGRFRRVYDELGYQPAPQSARIMRGILQLAEWPSNVRGIRG